MEMLGVGTIIHREIPMCLSSHCVSCLSSGLELQEVLVA